jgi:DNA-binding NtrC family response regulator
MRILVVDDEKNIRRAMAMALESMEHEVVCCESGAEGLRQIQRISFDAVFLDLKLHLENGLDILKEILRTAPEAAVIIVTAFASGHSERDPPDGAGSGGYHCDCVRLNRDRSGSDASGCF